MSAKNCPPENARQQICICTAYLYNLSLYIHTHTCIQYLYSQSIHKAFLKHSQSTHKTFTSQSQSQSQSHNAFTKHSQHIHKAFTKHSQSVWQRRGHPWPFPQAFVSALGLFPNARQTKSARKCPPTNVHSQNIHKTFTKHSQSFHKAFTKHSPSIHKTFIKHSQSVTREVVTTGGRRAP